MLRTPRGTSSESPKRWVSPERWGSAGAGWQAGRKTKTTDEFLVKKREPLVLPPDYNEIPKPGSIKEKQKNEKDKIKEILKVPNDQNLKKNKSSNIEESILDKIRK